MSNSRANGLTTVASVAARLADLVVASPSTLTQIPSSTNTFGQSIQLHALNNQADLTTATEQSQATHKVLAVLTDSSHLLGAIPTLYSQLASRAPTVLHTSLESDDYSSVTAVRQTGVAVLASTGTFEVLQTSVLAHLLALRSALPVVNVIPPKFVEASPALPVSYIERAITAFKLDGVIDAFHGGVQDIPGLRASDVPEFIKAAPASLVDFERVIEVARETAELLHVKLWEYTGASDATNVLIVLGCVTEIVENVVHKLVGKGKSVGVLRVRLYRPWSDQMLLHVLPPTVERVAVLDIANELTTPFGPLFLDVAAAFNSGLWTGEVPVIREAKIDGGAVVTTEIIHSAFDLISQSHSNVGAILLASKNQVKSHHIFNGKDREIYEKIEENSTESAYVKLLSQTFKDRLVLSNVIGYDSVWGKLGVSRIENSDYSTEFGFGLLTTYVQRRDSLNHLVSQLLEHSSRLSQSLASALKEWNAHKCDPEKAAKYAKEIIEALSSVSERSKHESLTKLWESKELLSKSALWLIGGDKLSYDIGNSGVHQVISSKENINILVLDTQPYSEKIDVKSGFDVRKKDIGLYAMTYGGVYVASIALNSSYAQSLRAIKEAEAFPGPSVILAYAPRARIENGKVNSVSLPLAVLKETKMAVDSGYWPLYRWNPSLDAKGEEQFQLDSDRIKKELKEFLERENHFAMLLKTHPDLPTTITESSEIKLAKIVKQKVHDSFNQLFSNLNATPILILYGSDGHNAASLAKRVASEAKQKGLRPRCMPMDDFDVEDLSREQFVLFIVSTAGQGEFPTNSKQTWKSLQTTSPGSIDFEKMQYAVFGLGDSHYWPLPEDAIYFAKPGKDLDEKLALLGAKRFAEYGIGDDQHPDGFMTGYNGFAPHLWKALGVDDVEVAVEVAAPPDDYIKESSNFLRGSIVEGLADTSTGALSELNNKLTKFHGIYGQDDRDLREDRARQGLEYAFSFMVRVRVPGGVCRPEQWLALDKISDKYANGTIKITTRQAIQFHGIVKKNLKQSIADMNHALMDTIAACGDVNRNVMCNPNPDISELHREVFEFSKALSAHLTPKTTAYHEIWLDKKLINTTDEEPIYGKTYLPRKFKIAIAVPPSNDVDVFAHDLGYIAIIENKKLLGFNVTVGGGMGMTHGNKKTFPRIADVLGFVTPDLAVQVAEKVVLVQRDNGDRTNRKHARLKYTIEDHGIEWFRNEVEKLLGFKLQKARPYKFTRNGDNYGWSRGFDGKWHFTLFVTNGRVKDTPEKQLKEALREIAKVLKGEFRFTPNQHLIISNIENKQKLLIETLLAKYGLSNDGLSGLRLNSMACVALPTCALAMAESERYLPSLITKIEDLLDNVGLREEEISIRMTGCPNGCARPQIAEIAFVGK
ncbi:hypothetical protein HK096_005539, partial [Nowakowskiella sp. JEL0078]